MRRRVSVGRPSWPLATLEVERPRMSPVDVVREGFLSVVRRPARTLLTASGTLFGAAAAVATLGLAATAERQVSERFDAIRATQVVVTASRPESGRPALPEDAEAVMSRLNGVVAAGIVAPLGSRMVSKFPYAATSMTTRLDVIAMTPQALTAIGPTVASGRLYDRFHQDAATPVAVLGRAAAMRLGVWRLDDQPAVFVDGQPFVVVGVLDDVDLLPEALSAVIVPTSAAGELGGVASAAELLVRTAPGAALTIARQAPYALRPDDPTELQSLAPPDPRQLRQRIEGDVRSLLLVIAAVSFVIGAITISNATLAQLLQRVPEVGLRRALGARRRHIAAQLLTETTVTGLVAGALGASLGVLALVIIALSRHWTPVMDLRGPLLAPGVGALAGLVAGAFPAWQAMRIDPIDALRR